MQENHGINYISTIFFITSAPNLQTVLHGSSFLPSTSSVLCVKMNQIVWCSFFQQTMDVIFYFHLIVLLAKYVLFNFLLSISLPYTIYFDYESLVVLLLRFSFYLSKSMLLLFFQGNILLWWTLYPIAVYCTSYLSKWVMIFLPRDCYVYVLLCIVSNFKSVFQLCYAISL